MTQFSSKELLESLIQDNQEIIDIVHAKFVSLSDQDLLWRPTSKKWSISECLDHLIRTGSLYLTRIDKKISKSYANENVNVFSSSWLGDYAVKSMKPVDGHIPMPMKTFGRFRPNVIVRGNAPVFPARVLEDFIQMQERFIQALETSMMVDLNQVKITSALGPIVRFKLGDAFRFITAHGQRHVLQAENVLNALNEYKEKRQLSASN